MTDAAGSAAPVVLGFVLPFSKAHAGRILFVIGLGLLLGVRHSTDADHVVALATIVSKQNSIRRAALIGSLWGLGHTITIFAVGSLIILFHVEIPVRLGLAMEFSVAVMLVILGLLNLTGVLQRASHLFTKGHETQVPGAPPKEQRPVLRLRRSIMQIGLFQSLRPLAIGLVHGLAGSAAVALLVLATIPDPVWATVYLLIFGFGTMLGMIAMTTLIAVPLAYGGRRFSRLTASLTFISGVVSLSFGLLLIYELGYVGGLFTRHPHWTPQ